MISLFFGGLVLSGVVTVILVGVAKYGATNLLAAAAWPLAAPDGPADADPELVAELAELEQPARTAAVAAAAHAPASRHDLAGCLDDLDVSDDVANGSTWADSWCRAPQGSYERRRATPIPRPERYSTNRLLVVNGMLRLISWAFTKRPPP